MAQENRSRKRGIVQAHDSECHLLARARRWLEACWRSYSKCRWQSQFIPAAGHTLPVYCAGGIKGDCLRTGTLLEGPHAGGPAGDPAAATQGTVRCVYEQNAALVGEDWPCGFADRAGWCTDRLRPSTLSVIYGALKAPKSAPPILCVAASLRI